MMAGLLTPVSTSHRATESRPSDALIEVVKPVTESTSQAPTRASTPSEALEILRSEPDYTTLISTLQYLDENKESFDVTSPSPLAAQIVNTLVSDVVPNYWNILNEPRRDKSSDAKSSKKTVSSELMLLLSCLRSVIGLNAILLRLKQQIQEAKASKREIGGHSVQETLVILLQMLEALIQGNKTSYTLRNHICKTCDTAAKQKSIWNELLGVIAGGKILGVAAEAEDIANSLSKSIGEKYWIADGKQYSLWLAQNVSYWTRSLNVDTQGGWSSCGELLSKSLRSGHTDIVVKELLASIVILDSKYESHFQKLLGALPNIEQRNVIFSVLKVLSTQYLLSSLATEDNAEWWQSDASIVSAATAIVTLLIAQTENRKAHLITWLTSSSGAGVGEGISIRRAVVASLLGNKTDLELVLDKCLSQFGDKLYINHTPTLQQEAHAQVLLLAAGCLHRLAPLRLTMMTRSGSHLGVVSNRLGASSPRARFLGMVVGEGLSGLVDKGDKRLDFKVDDMTTAEAKWFKSLVNVKDAVGSAKDLWIKTATPRLSTSHNQKPMSKPKVTPVGSKIIAIEEVDDDDEEVVSGSDDDGLVPYGKPDSDIEDSDEDATLVTRNKPTAPVYIRDLIKYLRDTDSYDRQNLALVTAASLIRRKANFGTEVSSHAEELAALLVGLQDKYEIDNFQDMRTQGMIAVLIALPLKMGQWYSKTFFDGDYSIAQRASVLTTLGLGARELGGFGSEDEAITKKTVNSLPASSSAPSFPSKTLPAGMHKLYAPPPTSTPKGPPSALASLSTQLSNTMIAPLAASLADKLTGPSILKIRTFSSRMAVEAKRKKPIANALAKIVADGFFFPLTGRFFVYLKAYGSSSNSNVIFQPYLLSLFIKTLALLLHSSGPNTLSLPQMTSEFWDLLLSLRMQSVGDIVVMEGLLFGFMTILELNEDKRRLVEAHGRQMLETQEWVEAVFGRVGKGGSEEDDRVRMLAAGVLVRIREVVEKYQALLMGDLASF